MNRVLYVPLDERACNYRFPAQLAEMTDDIVLVRPPLSLMGFKKEPADLEGLWHWLFAEAPSCSHAILSVDTLVYGNIINSRTHHRTLEQCAETLSRFRTLKEQNPQLEIHAFNLVARVAGYDSDAEDPDYWACHGRDIWHFTCLTDKESRGHASEAEIQELRELKQRIPTDILKDFLDRRIVDRATNLACVDLVEEGIFTMLTVPKDDTAEYGYAALDQMALAARVREKRLMDRVLVYPGADEVGSVLFTRVFNRIKGYRPRIYLRYSSTLGPTVVPLYEDRPLHESVKSQITSLGGVVLDSPERSDCMLALNTAGKAMIESMDQQKKDLTYSTHINLNELFRYIHYYHEEYGRPIGLAEVSVSNGCENECMELGLLTGAYDFLTAVGGWNTSQNTIGVVLAQTVIASYYQGFASRPDKRRLSDEFFISKLTADWLWQSNLLPQFLKETEGTIDPFHLGDHYDATAAWFRTRLDEELARRFPNGFRGRMPMVDTLSFQWDGVYFMTLEIGLHD